MTPPTRFALALADLEAAGAARLRLGAAGLLHRRGRAPRSAPPPLARRQPARASAAALVKVNREIAARDLASLPDAEPEEPPVERL